jgi:hypothetical protein
MLSVEVHAQFQQALAVDRVHVLAEVVARGALDLAEACC